MIDHQQKCRERQCLGASIISFMPCATSMPPPISIGGSAHGRRAQPASLGHAQSRRPIGVTVLHRTANAGRAGQTERRRHLETVRPLDQDFIARHDGLSMLILESADAKADAAAFAAANIAASEALTFERAGTKADGTPMKVGFSLAFARDPQPADIGFATCQQHFPENFWSSSSGPLQQRDRHPGGGTDRRESRPTTTSSCRPLSANAISRRPRRD